MFYVEDDLNISNNEPEDDCHCEDCDCTEEEAFSTIVMTDADTGEEYSFLLVDDFAFQGEHFCVLITDDEEEPEMVITKIVTMEDGAEGLMSLSEEEYDSVYGEYERLCDEEDDEDDEIGEED